MSHAAAPRLAGTVSLLAILSAGGALAACATSGGGITGVGDADLDANEEAGELDALADEGTISRGDSSVDAGFDAGFDSGFDSTTFDSGSPGDDAGGDAPVDTGHDSGHDSGHDAGADAKPEGGRDSGGDGSTVAQPTQGEVLITEVMYNPTTAEPNTEWIEVHSTVSSARRLSGLILKDGAGRTHTIASGPDVIIAAGAYMVLARLASDCETTAKVPASAIGYEYGTGLPSTSGILLANGSTGAITLLDAAGTTTVAQSPYGPWSLGASGKSLQLKDLTYAGESAKASWCTSATAWASGANDGTPGAAGDCP